MTLTSGTSLGPYQILSLLGAGGMGEVYLAEDSRLGRKVALKLLPAEFTQDADRLRRFTNEAKAASALNHPNILTIYEIGQMEGIHFIAAEYVEGQTLRQHITPAGMELPVALDVAMQVASALAAAHAAGIVHRDIKPENVMLRPDSLVKVLDFGLAKLTARQVATPDPDAPTMVRDQTQPGIIMGTLAYMSPEQVRGLEVDARSDIFSLGVVAYEMIASRSPFEEATTSDVIAAILRSDPQPLIYYSPTLPAELQRIIGKALRKDREERYQGVKDLLLDLKNLKQELELEARLGRPLQPELSGGQRAESSSGQVLGTTAEGRTDSSSGLRRGAAPRRRPSRKAINSLAVLPLANASADREAEYLSDGISESLINSLSQLPKLRVMARSTVFRYKGREADPITVGDDLNVRAVVTGRVHLVGDRLEIGIELVDTRDGSLLWGEKFNRRLADIFAVQEEIAQEITEKLRLKLTGEEKKKLQKRHTENTAAYQLYLKGRFHWNKRTPEGFKKGIEYFQQAIEKDPDYALAYAGLADSFNILATYSAIPPREFFSQAKAAAMKALAIDDQLAEAHTSLAYTTQLYDWDLSAAEREFKRAIKLNPNYANAHHWYSVALVVMGRVEECLAEMKRAQELDPLSVIINATAAWLYYHAHQYDRAIEQGLKALEMDAAFSTTHFFLGLAYVQTGRYAEAIAALGKAGARSGGLPVTVAALGHAYAVSGQRDEAIKILDQLIELSKQRYISPYDIARIYAGLGQKEEAFAWLEKAYEERSSSMTYLKVEPQFDDLHSDPRFASLLQRAGHTP